MGLIVHPITSETIRRFRDQYHIKCAVETGTFQGLGTSWLANNFEQVYTIEICEEYQNQAKEILKRFNNIQYFLGDSRDKLSLVVNQLTSSTLFWLDAHNTIQVYGPGPDDCPILEELSAILDSPLKHCILIDDMNAFLPIEQKIHLSKMPLDAQYWPSLNVIMKQVEQANYMCYINPIIDLMVVVPKDFAFT